MKSSVRKTRVPNLGYTSYGGEWHFVDVREERVAGMPARIGRWYPTRQELLADVERFAQERGFLAEDGGPRVRVLDLRQQFMALLEAEPCGTPDAAAALFDRALDAVERV